MKNVKDLGPNEGIIITSKKEAKKIVRLFQAAGLKPLTTMPYTRGWVWGKMAHASSIAFYPKHGTWCNDTARSMQLNDTLHPASDFFPPKESKQAKDMPACVGEVGAMPPTPFPHLTALKEALEAERAKRQEAAKAKEEAPALTFPRMMLVWNEGDPKQPLNVIAHNISMRNPYLTIEPHELDGDNYWGPYAYQFAEELPTPETITIAEAEERLSTPEKPVKVVPSP